MVEEAVVVNELSIIARQARDGFSGIVVCKDWILAPDGENYMAFEGTVTIVHDEQAIGFKVRGNDTNWMARIAGKSGMTINILGCQVRAVHAFGSTDLQRAPRAPIFVVS